MRDGSFEGQMTDLDFQADLDIRKVKTPDQIPDRVDLANVPESILRSGVMESLISQNDDLMSRLTVALRRVALLEEKISDTRNENAQFKTKYDNLKDQVLVLREQSRMVAERSRATEEKNKREEQSYSDLKEQIQVLEIRYAELYTSAQERQAKLEATAQELQSRLEAEIEDQNAEAQNKSAQLQAEIEIQKSSAAQFVRRYTKYRQNIRRAIVFQKEELTMLRAKRQNQEAVLQDLRKNLSDSTAYISEQAKEHKSQISSLTDAYEAQLRALKGEIEMLFEQNRVLGERSEDFEKTINDKVKLENDLIIAKRREEETELQTAAEISDIQKTLVRYRNDAKELAIELESKNADLELQTVTVESLAEDKQKLTEQVETLQLLWRDQQNHVERMNDQKNSLQKLNQELSITINEYRREIRELKDRLDASELKSISFKNEVHKKEQMRAELRAVTTESRAGEKTREGNANVVVVADTQANASTTAAAANTATARPEVMREDLLTPEIISKIDKVLSSLHIGH